jgi:DNA-binding beta-propeller fold protein YncE
MVLAAGTGLRAQATDQFRLVRTVALAGAKGHFDHFGFDAKRGRLFATLQQQGVVQVLDAATATVTGAIAGLGKPHAVLYRADMDRLFVTDGDHNRGRVHIVDGTSLKILKTIDLAPGAEQFGYDPTSRLMYVANGGHDAGAAYGFVSVIDTDKGEKRADIRIETPNLEGVAAEASGRRVYVNDRLHSKVVVIDAAQQRITAQWQISTAKLNVALALDEERHRLFVGCRSGQIVVIDTQTGAEHAALPIGEGVDDLFFDPASRRIFAATGAGGGGVEAYRQQDPDHYDMVGKAASAPGGKNGVYAPQLARYFVGAPDSEATPPAILVFDVKLQ